MKTRKNFFQSLQLSLCIAGSILVAGCSTVSAPIVSATHFQQALKLIDQGTMLMRQNNLDEAEGAFAAALDLAALPAASDGLGCLSFLRGDHLRAERYFVQAYQKDPKYGSALGNLALLYEVNGLPELAERFYKLALVNEPENFRTRNNFAAHLFAHNKRASSKTELQKAFALAKHPLIAANLMKVEVYE